MFSAHTCADCTCSTLRLRSEARLLGLQADLASGLSVGAMVIPQGMSYAKLAGLPSVWGLYGAFVPVLVYAGLGSSRQLVRPPSRSFHHRMDSYPVRCCVPSHTSKPLRKGASTLQLRPRQCQALAVMLCCGLLKHLLAA